MGTHEIELLINPDEIIEKELKAKTQKIFSKQLTNKGKFSSGCANLEIDPIPSPDAPKYFRVIISGPKNAMTSCNAQLHKDDDKSPLCLESTTLVRDDIGEILREKAYPELAHIEQRLRQFILSRVIELYGFDWWKTVATEDLKEESKRPKKIRNFTSRISLINFESIVTLVTTPPWEGKGYLDLDELIELTSSADSLEDLSEKIKEKRETNIWDNVLSNYFPEDVEWENLEGTINNLTTIRNKVMHHRPITRSHLKACKQAREEVDDKLDLAKDALQPETLKKVRKKNKELLAAFQHSMSIQATQAMQGAIQQFANQESQKLGAIQQFANQELQKLGAFSDVFYRWGNVKPKEDDKSESGEQEDKSGENESSD